MPSIWPRRQSTTPSTSWPVFPLRGKVPAIPNPHPKGSYEYQHCKGECGLQGHGVLDATTDIAVIAEWWGAVAPTPGQHRWPHAGVDGNDRHRPIQGWPGIAGRAGRRARTPTRDADRHAGRGDGGKHLFFRRPPGKLSAKRLGRGIDLKTSSGYGVLPPSDPSRHRVRPYVPRFERPVAAPPAWLVGVSL